MRTLGLFAAFIGLVGIAGGCKREPGPSEQPAADVKLFETGWNAFDEGDYKKAQEAFGELVARFPDTPEAAKASVILCLCKAHGAVNDHDWKGAQEHEQAARDRLKELQASAPGNSDLYTWTQAFKDVIDKFKDYRIAAWGFRNKLSRAEDLWAKDDFKAALDEMRRFDRPGALLPEAHRKELAVFKAKVELTRFRTDCSNVISKGDGLVCDGELAKAKLAYLEAKALLEGKQGLVLPKQEREKLLSQLAAKLKSVEASGRYEDAIAAANEARKDGDKVGEMAALQWAQKIKPSAEVQARIKSLRPQVDMARFRDPGKGATAEAIKALKKLLEHDPDNSDAKALLNGLGRRADWRKALSEADMLYRKKEYAKALAKYEEATALIPLTATVKERMVDCRYRIKVNEAEQLRHADKLYEAIEAYEKALKIRPDRAAWISARQELCKRELQYRAHLEAGETARQNKDWKGALAEYRKARKIKETPEITVRIMLTSYAQLMALGRAAQENGDPEGAKKYFERAKMIFDPEKLKEYVNPPPCEY